MAFDQSPERAHLALEARYDSPSTETDSWLVVKLAADKRQGDMAMLLKSRADPNVLVPVEWRNYATSPLFEASVSGHTKIVRMLLGAGADINQSIGPGYTPLYNAAFQGHGETVRILAEAGADINASTDEQFTPLYIACQEGHADCALTLLKHGAHPDHARPDEGATALYIASQNGRSACVESLIHHRATIDKPMFDGSTPLMIACYFAHARVVELLLRAGASLAVFDKRGRNALEWAKKRDDPLVVALVQEELAARTTARTLGGGFGNLFGLLGPPSAAPDGGGAGAGASGLVGALCRATLPCLAPPSSASRGAGGLGDESPGIGVRATPHKSAMKKDGPDADGNVLLRCCACLPKK